MSEPIKVPRLAKGHGYKGPEFYGCFNTGMAPCIFHSRTGKYVVGPEIPCRDAMRAGMTLFDKRRSRAAIPAVPFGFSRAARPPSPSFSPCAARRY